MNLKNWARGRPFASSSTTDFCSFSNEFGMVHLGYSDNPFTWSNNRKRPYLIKECLDRGIATCDWIHLFPSFARY